MAEEEEEEKPTKLVRSYLLDLHERQIRLELNAAKWPAIWAPSHSGIRKPRHIERTVFNPDGSTDVQSLIVEHVSEVGTLTTEELKLYLALVLLWEENGRETSQPTPFSFAKLAKIMELPWPSGITAAKLRQSLDRLGRVPVTWNQSFYHKPSQRWLKLVKSEHFLSYLVFAEKRVKGKKVEDQEKGAFKFDQKVIDNLLANYSKPLYLADALGLRSDLAILLFMHLDVVMADKSVYERNSAKLFHDLGLGEHKKYKYPSGRRQGLQPAIAELRNKRLSTGVITKIELIPNSAQDDFKLSVRKGPQKVIDIAATPIPKTQKVATQSQAEISSDPSDPKDQLIARLVERGAARRWATTYLRNSSPESLARLEGLIEYFDYIVKADKAKVKSPGGFLRTMIEEDWLVPPNFRPSRLKVDIQRGQQTEPKPASERPATRNPFGSLSEADSVYQAWWQQQVEAALATKSKEEIESLEAQVRQEASRKFSKQLKSWDREVRSEVFQQMFRQQIAKELNLICFEDWLEQRLELSV